MFSTSLRPGYPTNAALPQANTCHAVSDPRSEKLPGKLCQINFHTVHRTLRHGAMRCCPHDSVLHVLHLYAHHAPPRIITQSVIFTTLHRLKRHANSLSLSCERILTNSYLTLRGHEEITHCRHHHGDSVQSPPVGGSHP